MEMFIKKNGNCIELYNFNLEHVNTFKDATYTRENGMFYIHSIHNRFDVFCEMPESTTSILYITPEL